METIEEILQLVKKKMEEQAAYDREAYEDLVDQTIEYFREKGKLDDDENDEFIKNQMMMMWETVRDEFADKKV